jgi:hypothetical protein
MALGTAPAQGDGFTATLKRAPRQIAVGVVLVLATVAVGVLTETRGVERYTALDRSAETVISVGADRIDPSHEGALVHVRGGVQSTQELVDETFGVKVAALRLVRHVEVYAWEETKREEKRKNDKGEEETVTTYSYTKRFQATPADSSRFKEAESHKNPEKAAFTDQDFTAKDARLGAFVLPSEALGKLTKLEPVRVSQDMLARSPHATKLRELEGAAFYGAEVQNPQVGDLRISYQMVRPQPVSVVAKQSGGTFVAYEPTPGVEPVFLVQAGEVESKSMFATAKDDTPMSSWLFRALGVLLGAVAFALVLLPFSERRPLLPGFAKAPRVSGVLVGLGLGVAAYAATMGGTWVSVRPAFAVPLFIVSLVSVVLSAMGAVRARKA